MEGGPKAPETEEQVQYPEISSEILRMAEEDQHMRLGVEKGGEWDSSIDARNTERMKAIVEEIGWPTKSKVGEWASYRTWLLVQHADHDPEFQKHCLELLKAEPAGEVQPGNIGYLEDRIRTKEDHLQVYGTQFYTDENGTFGPVPIENPEQLDERRASLGMEPFEEYKAHMQGLPRDGK